MATEHERLNAVQQLGRTYRAMMTAFDAQVGHALPRWRILLALYEQGQCSQKQLVEQVRIDPASLTRQLKAMEAQGWVSRATDAQDNRLTNVTLTQQGRAVVDEALPRRTAFYRDSLAVLSSEQLQLLNEALGALEQRFREVAQAHRE